MRFTSLAINDVIILIKLLVLAPDVMVLMIAVAF